MRGRVTPSLARCASVRRGGDVRGIGGDDGGKNAASGRSRALVAIAGRKVPYGTARTPSAAAIARYVSERSAAAAASSARVPRTFADRSAAYDASQLTCAAQ